MTESQYLKTEEFISKYETKETIGKGSFSTVILGINKATKEKVAIKILEKNKIINKEDLERVEKEIKILKNLNNLNIVNSIEIFETEDKYYFIMEYCENGELFNYIVEKQKLNEKEASYFYYQLINGLEYIHSKGVVHRDLKPENLLLGKGNILKIVDFGLSNFFDGVHYLSTPCGSPCYASPEMVCGNDYNGFYIDVWSTGIILYAMIYGYLPFEDPDNEILFKKIAECDIEYPGIISKEVKSLLTKIIVSDPEERIKIEEIKVHPFYLQGKQVFKYKHPEFVDDKNEEKKDNERNLNNMNNENEKNDNNDFEIESNDNNNEEEDNKYENDYKEVEDNKYEDDNKEQVEDKNEELPLNKGDLLYEQDLNTFSNSNEKNKQYINQYENVEKNKTEKIQDNNPYIINNKKDEKIPDNNPYIINEKKYEKIPDNNPYIINEKKDEIKNENENKINKKEINEKKPYVKPQINRKKQEEKENPKPTKKRYINIELNSNYSKNPQIAKNKRGISLQNDSININKNLMSYQKKLQEIKKSLDELVSTNFQSTRNKNKQREISLFSNNKTYDKNKNKKKYISNTFNKDNRNTYKKIRITTEEDLINKEHDNYKKNNIKKNLDYNSIYNTTRGKSANNKDKKKIDNNNFTKSYRTNYMNTLTNKFYHPVTFLNSNYKKENTYIKSFNPSIGNTNNKLNMDYHDIFSFHSNNYKNKNTFNLPSSKIITNKTSNRKKYDFELFKEPLNYKYLTTSINSEKFNSKKTYDGLLNILSKKNDLLNDKSIKNPNSNYYSKNTYTSSISNLPNYLNTDNNRIQSLFSTNKNKRYNKLTSSLDSLQSSPNNHKYYFGKTFNF